MNSYPAPTIPDGIVRQVRELAESGADQERLIHQMRDLKLGIIPSIKLLAQFCDISVFEAKRAVHLSPIWADCRTSNDALHETALQVLQHHDQQTQELKTA
jgi:hypothetical protein